MPAEKARAIVVRKSDWSESSRIATLWTREFGKMRVLAKGGRRLGTNFEVALDLLTVCSIVVLRKNTGGLELLTEARIEERFPGLRNSLESLNAGYYIAELLGEGTQEHDPHPLLYDEAIATLRRLSLRGTNGKIEICRFELVWLRELGYRPQLHHCTVCAGDPVMELTGTVSFSPSAGGVLCPVCAQDVRDRRPILPPVLTLLRLWDEGGQEETILPEVVRECRHVLGMYVSYVLGRRPRLLSYLDG